MNATKAAWPAIKASRVILVMASLIGVVVLTALFSSRADTQSPQAIQTIDLGSTTANVSVLGATADDRLSGNDVPDTGSTRLRRAHAVVTGDFNKDNIQDLAIGAPETDFTPQTGSTRANAGAVYIVFGKATFTNPVIDAATNQPDIRVFGAAADDALGFALAAGDVNGDGTDDLLIGAPGADFPGTGTPETRRADTGAVFVIFGSNTLTPAIIDLATSTAVKVAIYGKATGDNFGSAIAVGNVGGASGSSAADQAVKDIFVGAPNSRGPNPSTAPRNIGGAAFLVFGGPSLNPAAGSMLRVIDLAATATPPNVEVYGEAESTLGISVAIGDINDAGLADLIIGAPRATRPQQTTPPVTQALQAGAAYVVFGGANLNPSGTATFKTFDIASTQAAQRPSISIYGSDANDHLGASVASGDITGNGVADLAIGAPDADGRANAQTDAGEAYVISGSQSLGGTTETRIDVAVSTVNLTIYGAAVGDRLGATVVAGRVNTVGNTDTITDLLVGSPLGDAPGRANAGSVSIFFGGPGLLLFAERDLGLGQDDIRILGQAADDQLGWAIAAGDLNNDTGFDIIIGAPFNDPQIQPAPARQNAGKVYVLLASVIPPVNQNPVVMVVAPNGGEPPLVGGTTFNITWTASDPNGDGTILRFDIFLSTDGGANFNQIIAFGVAGTARSFTWSVPLGVNTNQARIRVIAFDNAGGQGQDDSNSNFIISDVGTTVTVTTPNGGEQLRFRQMFEIRWTVPMGLENQIRGFDIFLSTDGGVTFPIPIAFTGPTTPALPANARSSNWTVSEVCTSQARILVTGRLLSGGTALDSSNANFSISAVGPTIDVSEMSLDETRTVLTLRTTQPTGGNEVVFASGVTLEITNAAGTQFVQVSRVKLKKGGRRLLTKGTFGGQELGVFFPEGATRTLRVTNPGCGITQLVVRRQGERLVVVNPVPAQSEWQ